MISKVAIQAGLGVTAVGGVAGVVAWQLMPETENDAFDYLVVTSETVTGGADDDLKEKDDTKSQQKNYFCQWGTGSDKKDDKDCIIKKIKFDGTKKTSLLSEIIAEFTGTPKTATEAATKDNLKAADNWFLLKVKGYTDNLETSPPSPKNIDIFSNKEKKSNPEEFKKYATLKPIVKIKKSKAIQGKTKTFLTKFTSTPPSEEINASTTYKCKLTTTAEAANIKSDDKDLQSCDVYKFGDTNKVEQKNNKTTKVDISSAGKTTSKDDFKHKDFYIITFTDSTTGEQNMSTLNDTTTIVYVNGSNPSKKVGDFKVINPIVGKAITGSTLDSLILLN